MGLEQLNDLNKSQRDRLAYIDLRLCYTGTVNRQDIVDRFEIRSAAATRDFALYRDLAPKNIEYDNSQKHYTCGKWFSPLFEFDAEQVLAWISGGYGDTEPLKQKPIVLAESTRVSRYTNKDVLAALSRSIYSKSVSEISYRSLSSGLTTRQIVPFAFIENEQRWYVRAFDRRNKEFRDFSLKRIIVSEPTDQEAHADELADHDIQWNRIVELELVPHPANVQHPDTIETEYAMEKGVLRIKLRAALAGYFLRRWNVDCSEDHSLKGAEYHLWLKNRQALYGIQNLFLAPGYASEGRKK